MAEQPVRDRIVLSFGRFSLVPGERLLTADGAPLELGERTLDTLIALLSRPNEVVGKRELMAQVWPDVTVEEGSLRFHIAALRKALGDGKDGARYITTFAGRGYCFVAPVTQAAGPIADAPAADAASSGTNFLPEPLARMVGRENDIRAISAELAASRFVTIVGPGGIGKTTVAIAVAHDLLRGVRRGRAVRRSQRPQRSRAWCRPRSRRCWAYRSSPTTRCPAWSGFCASGACWWCSTIANMSSRTSRDSPRGSSRRRRGFASWRPVARRSGRKANKSTGCCR